MSVSNKKQELPKPVSTCRLTIEEEQKREKTHTSSCLPFIHIFFFLEKICFFVTIEMFLCVENFRFFFFHFFFLLLHLSSIWGRFMDFKGCFMRYSRCFCVPIMWAHPSRWLSPGVVVFFFLLGKSA